MDFRLVRRRHIVSRDWKTSETFLPGRREMIRFGAVATLRSLPLPAWRTCWLRRRKLFCRTGKDKTRVMNFLTFITFCKFPTTSMGWRKRDANFDLERAKGSSSRAAGGNAWSCHKDIKSLVFLTKSCFLLVCIDFSLYAHSERRFPRFASPKRIINRRERKITANKLLVNGRLLRVELSREAWAPLFSVTLCDCVASLEGIISINHSSFRRAEWFEKFEDEKVCCLPRETLLRASTASER